MCEFHLHLVKTEVKVLHCFWNKLYTISGSRNSMIRESINVCSQWGQTSKSEWNWTNSCMREHKEEWLLYVGYACVYVCVHVHAQWLRLFVFEVSYDWLYDLLSPMWTHMTWELQAFSSFPHVTTCPGPLPIFYRWKLRCWLNFRGNSDAQWLKREPEPQEILNSKSLIDFQDG